MLKRLLPLWKAERHKAVIFTQTQSMLGILEAMMKALNLTYIRMDGSTGLQRRDVLVQTFNNDPDIFAGILTTRTGGVGISLTAANRVVIIDPDWNPQTDIQVCEP